MSSDNSIAVLKTLDGKGGNEYRVRHLQGLDNMQWDKKTGGYSGDPDVHIENARNMWKGCEVFKNAIEAFDAAHKMEREILNDDFCPFLEYGVVQVVVPRKF